MNGQANGNEKAPAVQVSNLARDQSGAYVPSRALELIPEIVPILHTFLSGDMKEADEQLKNGDPRGETLYYSLGRCVIESLKAFMSFEHADLRDAIEISKHCGAVSQAHRRHVTSMASRISGFISRSTSGTAWIKGMNDVERHAELCYQEHLLIKAVLGILYSGDWFQFIKEALHLRSANIAYRTMNEFLREADVAADGYDNLIDQHFRSGVMFGVAMNSLILSLLPHRVLALAQLFGYEGNRTESLKLLYAIGGWTKDSDEPMVGNRRRV
ncbi:uncharacterized protein EI90DRAFT_594776 [Cantharellus anzutake]|uniref:uncharacterized protein n=1 Tax=Cantharellus anzutake TaxID=1750568 RepID=UPI0019053A9B|nr:uncharacterized protein EI90DRAFT_594776 [Cantharellus anzutake]KAF8313294.1 hypothetical protein EI90DRAFT_594776 [Cantharellus anzutake]